MFKSYFKQGIEGASDTPSRKKVTVPILPFKKKLVEDHFYIFDIFYYISLLFFTLKCLKTFSEAMF